ncbi:MAG: peptidoglycan DD-metalloendopeptidase family protein [Balneolaceae bacterium]|nr:peptidoglycan DD-metalloendopeptidase family protein [Balneolaceae bacterium]
MSEQDLRERAFHRVMKMPGDAPVLDLGQRRNISFIRELPWAIGRYNEKRRNMYLAPQYEGRRNIHMGIDLWTRAGAPVYAFGRGEIAYLADHDQQGNYGPTIVTRHRVEDAPLWALHGHLSRGSLERWKPGDDVGRGALLARLGTEEENGGWVPHLHFQISREDPGEADMPGVVAEEEISEALRRYPDPRIILGEIY